jgi:release factor glutamine methyltransferase
MFPLRVILKYAEAQLVSGPHPERARRDAEILLCHALGHDRAWLLAHTNNGFEVEQGEFYDALLARRTIGEPIQYIIGETEFYGLPFRVTPDVLIPRPETEHLVEKVLELAANFPAPRIVDVGTGSGCIAIALAHKLPQAYITAIDLSKPALAIARENARRNGVTVRFLEGDLLAPVTDEKFEFIVSNPPYVAEADRESLFVEVREYEPALALFAGDDVLAVNQRLIPAAFCALTPGGFVALEIGFGQAAAISELLATSGFEQIEYVPDLQRIPRVACAQRPS